MSPGRACSSKRRYSGGVKRAPLTLLVALALVLVAPAAAHKPNHPPDKNCTTFNKKYPHGVGKVGARDRNTNGRVLTDPVTNFRRSNRIYAAAMAHIKGLDRDKDKIACEKK
jgi:hypothetical protein